MTDNSLVTCSKEFTTVTVTVTDDFNPKFEKDLYNGTVEENESENYPVIEVRQVQKRNQTKDHSHRSMCRGSRQKKKKKPFFLEKMHNMAKFAKKQKQNKQTNKTEKKKHTHTYPT